MNKQQHYYASNFNLDLMRVIVIIILVSYEDISRFAMI
jgi:hypothetical protein